MNEKRLSWASLGAIKPPAKAELPTKVTETQVPMTQVPETQVQASAPPVERPEPRPVTAEPSLTEVPVTRVSRTQVRATQVAESPVDRASGRYTRLDNQILDEYLPRLDPHEQLVYLRLYRLTVGFSGRTKCVVSHEKLAQKTHLSLSTIKRVCANLEANGVLSSRPILGGKRHERGCEFQLLEPTWLTETQVEETRVNRTPAKETRATGTQVGLAHMKDSEKNPEKAPAAAAPADVYSIRTVAARLFEAHRFEPGFDHDRLRELVRDALIGQGRQPDAEAIEEAIKGMAG